MTIRGRRAQTHTHTHMHRGHRHTNRHRHVHVQTHTHMHTGLNATAAGQHRTRPWVRAMERTALMAMATERNETSISTNTTAATLAIATWKRSNTCAIMSVSAGEPIEREEGGWVGEAGGEDVLCVCVCV